MFALTLSDMYKYLGNTNYTALKINCTCLLKIKNSNSPKNPKKVFPTTKNSQMTKTSKNRVVIANFRDF